jgi:hypothetical protein
VGWRRFAVHCVESSDSFRRQKERPGDPSASKRGLESGASAQMPDLPVQRLWRHWRSRGRGDADTALGKKGSLVAANWRCSPGCKIKWVNRWRPGEALKRAAISIGSCFRKWRKSDGESRIRAIKRAVGADWLLVSLLYTVVWKLNKLNMLAKQVVFIVLF